jgi:hypothetical protein
MPDILIRDVPDDVARALTEKAMRAGTMDRQAWIRKKLIELAAEPIITERYAYRVYSESGSKGMIKRYSDHPNGTSATFSNFSQQEADTIHKAEDLIRRNGPGDREKAVALLQGAFEEVMEVPV